MTLRMFGLKGLIQGQLAYVKNPIVNSKNCLRATHVAIILKYEAGRFDPEVFVNCRVQSDVLIIAMFIAHRRFLLFI